MPVVSDILENIGKQVNIMLFKSRNSRNKCSFNNFHTYNPQNLASH